MRTISFIASLALALFCSCGQTSNGSRSKVHDSFPTTPLGNSLELASTSQNERAGDMLFDFYTKYITAFDTEPTGDSMEKKLKQLQRQYCSVAFLKQIPAIQEQTEADVILQAQDSDVEFLKTLTVSESSVAHEYYVCYLVPTTPGETAPDTIHVRVIKERSDYKIDSVWKVWR